MAAMPSAYWMTSKLNELILATEPNNFRPPVASKSLRDPGAERGRQLILLQSLIAHLAAER
jgi:hypothetical protein